MKILLAGKDEKSLDMLSAYLSDTGHEVETARNGLGCIAHLRSSLPDLLIMEQDLLWGGSNGVLSRMNDDSVLSTIPVILLETHAESETEQQSPQIIAHFVSPFRPRDLMRLQQYLGKPDLSRRLDSLLRVRRPQLATSKSYASQPWL